MNKKNETLTLLRTSEKIYMILSNCTNMPYVVCDPETYDDQILMYWDENNAVDAAKKILENGDPVQVVRLENKMLLNFYGCLYQMGVNGIAVNKGLEDEMAVQLPEFVVRPKIEDLPDGPRKIENPQFHLTALYFVQGFRKNGGKMAEELKELYEEMMVHFTKGKYIVAVDEEKKVPLLKQKEGHTFQPVFTELSEFAKFDKERKYQMIFVEASKIVDILAEEAEGIVINPFGVNVILQMKKSE